MLLLLMMHVLHELYGLDDAGVKACQDTMSCPAGLHLIFGLFLL